MKIFNPNKNVIIFKGDSNQITNVWEEDYLDMLFPYELSDEEDEEDDHEYCEDVEMVDSKLVNEVKREIQSYFIDKYGISLKEKLSKIKDDDIWYVKYEGRDLFENEYFERGYLKAEDGIPFLELSVAFENKETIKSRLLHLFLEYIGIESEEIVSDMILEGVIEAISEEIAKQNRWEYKFISAYRYAYHVAKQILVVNKDLVKNILENEEFSFANHFNNIMYDVPLYDIDEGFMEPKPRLVFITLGGTLYDVMSNRGGKPDSFYHYIQMQLIVIAYCRKFNPSEEQIEEIRKSYFYPDFETGYHYMGEDENVIFIEA